MSAPQLRPSQVLGDIIGTSDRFTHQFLSETYPALAAKLLPVLALLIVIFWGAYVLRLYFGRSAFSVWDVTRHAVWTVLAFNALQWGSWATGAYTALTGAIEAIAATILGGQPSAESIIEGLLDSFDPILAVLGQSNWYTPAYALHYVLIFALLCVLAVLAFVNLALAKFGLAIVFLMAPLFVCCAVFPVTRGWFNAWLGKLFNFALIYILSVTLIRFGAIALATVIDTVNAMGRAAADTDLDGFVEHLNTGVLTQMYLVPLVLIVFLFQVRGWAAAMSGSHAVQGVTGTAAAILLRAKALR